MHYIQKHILDELRVADSVRYAQLNRDEIESGHFRYHLAQLIKDGYIAQLERGLYALTVSGQQYVDKLSEGRIKARPMPKVITYTLLRDGDFVVLQEKQKQPYMHQLNMVGGKLHEGESSEQAAIREVQEKTGNIIEKPKLAGVFEIITYSNDAVFTHVVAYVYTADVQAASYKQASLHVVGLLDLESTTNLAPDCLEVIRSIQNVAEVQVRTIKVQL